MPDLDKLAKQAGEALQEIQDEIGDRTHVSDAITRFPRGYVRPTRQIFWSLPMIGDNTKVRNLAYQLMRADVCRWLLSRTDIYGQVQSVVVAEYICILAYGVEFYVKTLTHRRVGRNRPFGSHTQWLVDHGTIDVALKDELDWMWEVDRSSVV